MLDRPIFRIGVWEEAAHSGHLGRKSSDLNARELREIRFLKLSEQKG